ncbi:MAG: hypothetical protein NPINA01_02790 [Nitrospinaceae bacterium]|nr:MAG: hypothetical protein NPINA01_02790 [Nitrospinaceae bacterium]
MKKLMVLMIAMSFLIVGSVSALADEPEAKNSSRHAVWDDWFDDKGDRLTGALGTADSTGEMERKVSTQTSDKSEMQDKKGEFDFLNETKTYDYEKDRGNSA